MFNYETIQNFLKRDSTETEDYAIEKAKEVLKKYECFSELLNGREELFEKCKDKTSVLISPEELSNYLGEKYPTGAIEVTEIINNLVLDNYISMVLSDRKGKQIFCISLEKKGESFLRDLETNKKKTINLINYNN